jgi:hypothetical protein
MKNIKSGFVIILIFLCLVLSSCNSVDPPPPNGEKPTLTLELEDISCIEAWIKLTTTNIQLPASITLQQNNQNRKTINLIKADTLIYVDSLLPNTSYQYQASSIENPATSNELGVTTMDTTSHNFTFETFTFGGTAGSSTLYDVAIIEENNIWAVGEILVADTSVNGYTTYNAIHWDGSQWELKRITVDFRGNLITPPLEGVFAFSNTDIWFVGSLPVHGDGENWIMYDLRTTVDPNITVSKAWGSSSSDMYFVGRNGNIARYLNGKWSRIESGTEISLSDIYESNTNEIFISGTDNLNVKGIILKNLDAMSFTTLITSEIITENELFSKLYGSLSSVWVDNNNTLYTGGNILFSYKFDRWDYVRSMPENFIGGNQNTYYRGFIHSIRGNNRNDYWVVGDRNTVRHFNGFNWKQIGEPYDPTSNSIWWSVRVLNNICVIVGDNATSALILMIKK